MPTVRFETAGTVIDGKIYVAGGQAPDFVTSDALERYDPVTDSWEQLAPMPAPRSALGGGEIDGEFCVFGGRLANPSPTGDAFPETFCYDPATDTWSTGPDMITPRVEPAWADFRGAVYALGGRNEVNFANATVERLKLSKGGGKKEELSYALQFDGSPQSTITPDADGLDLTTTWTIEMWIKPSNVTAWLQHLVSKWGCCDIASWHLAITNEFGMDRLLQLGTRDNYDGPNTFAYSTTSLQNNVWQHVAAVFDNGEARLYINGELDAVQPGMVTPQIGPTPVSLARQNSPDGYKGKPYYGLMDEVRIWNVARTARQIQRSMNKEISPKSKGLVAYWRMDEGTGDTAFDLTGDGHDMHLGEAVGPDAGDPSWVTPGKL
jgi:hypothetical protein